MFFRNAFLCGAHGGIDMDFSTFQILEHGCEFMNFTDTCKKEIISETENGIQVYTSSQGS